MHLPKNPICPKPLYLRVVNLPPIRLPKSGSSDASKRMFAGNLNFEGVGGIIRDHSIVSDKTSGTNQILLDHPGSRMFSEGVLKI